MNDDGFVILVDMRENNGHIVALADENDNIAQFATAEDAEECAINNNLCRHFPHKIVNMDE